MTQQCHWCGTVENLKSFVCNGSCKRKQEHGTSICKECFCRTTEFTQSRYDNWDKTTYHWMPKYAELDVEKTFAKISKYYVDKGETPEKANQIAMDEIRRQQALRGKIPT